MIFLEIVILGLLTLLLVRSVNHENRMDKLERFIGKLINKIKADEVMNAAPIEDIFSHETVDNVDEPVEVKEVNEDGNEDED